MLQLKSKPVLAGEAHKLAGSYHMVRYRNTTYIPADFESRLSDPAPEPERTIWIPLKRDDVRRLAADQFDTLFSSDSELSSFDFMLAQCSTPNDQLVNSLLVRTPDGLKQLTSKGTLEDPSGDFVPNTLHPMLNEDVAHKDRVFSVIVEWVNSEEEAHSLLYHLATSLAPGWSAVKYMLLLGEGRNGKGLLLKMLLAIFGRENLSSVTRQDMSEKSPVVTELNGKLLNIIFDGQQDYLKDSGVEKTLIAGEPAPIRKLYDSSSTIVQSNALFIEALNNEPKSKDKSSALQKRLVRFQFPNVYPLDKGFEKLMLSEDSLGAFLSLLIDHYVGEDEVAGKLALTQKAVALQLEHMYVNSLALQFLKHLEDHDPLGHKAIIGEPVSDLVQKFQSWRVKENDLGTWAEPDVMALFTPLINSERQSQRTPAGPRKVRVVTSMKIEAIAFLESLKGEDDDTEALVAD